jgi:hypothetical protein
MMQLDIGKKTNGTKVGETKENVNNLTVQNAMGDDKGKATIA